MSDDNDSDDPRTPADKDSTGKNHNKKNEKSYNAASLTPMGNVAVNAKRTVTVSMITEEMPARDEPVNLDRLDVDLEEKFKGLNVLMRLNYSGPTEKGIDGGRITRLTVTEGQIGSERIAAHFDNEKWVRKPKTALEIQARMRAQKEHNGLEMPTLKPTFDQSNKPKLKP